MAPPPVSVSLPLLLTLLYFSTPQKQQGGVSAAELVLEEGYTVSTVLDGNKLSLPNLLNPTSLLPRQHLAVAGPARGRVTHDLVLLDTPNSIFYSLSYPISQDSEINRISGNGSAGFADGDLGSAMFNRPRSFAIDPKGNVYVADKTNHAIRKITMSGVSTIAGGHTMKPGKVDGPAQDATFSDDFELAFVPHICALLITDRGNRLIRQINLKSDDCATGPRPPLQLGLTLSAVLGLSCLLLGLATGGVISYHFLKPHESTRKPWFSETWNRSQIRLGSQVQIVCSDFKSAIASSRVYSLMCRLVKITLSHLYLMFSSIHGVEQTRCRQPVSFFDSVGASNHKEIKPEIFADQLKDLITFDDDLHASDEIKETFELGDEDGNSTDVLANNLGTVDNLMHANLLDFSQEARQQCPPKAPFYSSGLVKRK